LIFKNFLISNNIQAQDDGVNNDWDNSSLGNYWSDYGGRDTDDNGIGDAPYYIIGTGSGQDNYPIWDDGETIFPNISIISPTNYSVYGIESPSFQVSIVEPNLYSSWYFLNDTYYEFFTGEIGTISQGLWDLFPDGDVKITFWANSTDALTDWEYVIVQKNSNMPYVNIISPASNQLFGENSPTFEVEIFDTNLDTMWYTIDGGVTNITFSTNGTINQNNWTSHIDGPVTIIFYANDTFGLLNSAQVIINKDTSIPNINIISPSPDQLFGDSTPSFDVEISDPNLDTMWYTIDGGMTNITFMSNGTIDQNNWTGYIDGPVTILFYANDSVGYINSAQVIINKDTSIPNINIISPSPDQLFGDSAPSFDVEISDPNLDTMWYTIDGGMTNITFMSNGTIDQNNWTAHIDGPVTILFYANDSVGHINSAQVIINKDTSIPNINIISPSPDQLFSESTPSFDVEISDPNLDTMWYTIDGGVTNITFISNGTIDQNNWTAHIEGPVTILFYANDTLGHINSSQILINKDTSIPTINIITPLPGQLFGANSPDFAVEIYDLNLDTMWYTIDGGVTNIFFLVNQTIDQNNWTAHIDGPVTITFYANDTLGYINSTQVLIYKDTIIPTINIITPLPGQLFGANSPDFSVEIYDLNLDTMWYTIDGGVTNITFTTNGTIDQNNWTAHNDGQVTITFYANDTFGRINSAQVIINKDSTTPIINIVSPNPNQLFGSTSPDFIVEISCINLDTMWYTIDGGLTNITFTFNSTINQASWNLMPDGTITIKFYANNTLGKIDFQEVIVRKDIESPIISILSPTMNEVFEIPPAYEMTITEANLDKIWYTLNSGTNKIFLTDLIGVIDLTLWNQLPNGYVIITFYANDTLGNIDFDEVIVIKDTPTPSPPPGGIPGYNVIILLGMVSLIAAFIIRTKFNKK